MRNLILAGLLASLATPAMADGHEAAAELPGWMTGCWEMREGDRWAEECWTIPRAGLMMGSGRTGTGDVLGGWEFMRITLEPPAGGSGAAALAFAASPGGQGWTSFAAAEDDAPGVTFVNTRNDYPQRIRYWREGEQLLAEIALADGSSPIRFVFRRMGG
jgi:hypothetical protein